MKKFLTLLLIFLVACSSHETRYNIPGPTGSPSELRYSTKPVADKLSASRCGVERWAVKTMTDPTSGLVSQSSKAAVADLVALEPPVDPDMVKGRDMPVEITVYTVEANLVGYKQENDKDYHLVIADLDDPKTTMIAEIPSPTCAPKSTYAGFWTKYRTLLDDTYGQPGKGMLYLAKPVKVKITGVGFFDRIHGQTGVAPNGIELHPVIDLQLESAGT